MKLCFSETKLNFTKNVSNFLRFDYFNPYFLKTVKKNRGITVYIFGSSNIVLLYMLEVLISIRSDTKLNIQEGLVYKVMFSMKISKRGTTKKITFKKLFNHGWV